MCPKYSDGVCMLEPEKGKIKEPMPIYYCLNKQRENAYESCPVYQKKAFGEERNC